MNKDHTEIIDALFNRNIVTLTVISLSNDEYRFRISKNALENTIFPTIKPQVDTDGQKWYFIGQYHLFENDVVELFMTTEMDFKLYYTESGTYEKVENMYF